MSALLVALMFGLTLAVSVLPLFVRGSDRLLHSFIALACGIFLGAVFLHLLPEVSEHAHDNPEIWTYVLVGVLAVFMIESLLVRTPHHHDSDQHQMVSYTAFVGLAVHSVTEGLGLAALLDDERLAIPLFLSIVSHHAPAGFSLCSMFRLAEFSRVRSVVLLAVFAALTPVSILVGRFLLVRGTIGDTGVLTALAAGTFLFVAMCELLPEIFHRPGDRARKVAIVVAGIALMYLMHSLWGHHTHE